jgi:hypothetical protein
MPQQHDPTVTVRPRTARRLPTEPVTPFPPTTQIRVYTAGGRATTLHPLADVLSPRTRATLAAIDQQMGGNHGR